MQFQKIRDDLLGSSLNLTWTRIVKIFKHPFPVKPTEPWNTAEILENPFSFLVLECVKANKNPCIRSFRGHGQQLEIFGFMESAAALEGTMRVESLVELSHRLDFGCTFQIIANKMDA